jgi:hypothetical protein
LAIQREGFVRLRIDQEAVPGFELGLVAAADFADAAEDCGEIRQEALLEVGFPRRRELLGRIPREEALIQVGGHVQALGRHPRRDRRCSS